MQSLTLPPSGSSKWLASRLQRSYLMTTYSVIIELETYAKANVELLSRVANVALASSDTFSESGLLHW